MNISIDEKQKEVLKKALALYAGYASKNEPKDLKACKDLLERLLKPEEYC